MDKLELFCKICDLNRQEKYYYKKQFCKLNDGNTKHTKAISHFDKLLDEIINQKTIRRKKQKDEIDSFKKEINCLKEQLKNK